MAFEKANGLIIGEEDVWEERMAKAKTPAQKRNALLNYTRSAHGARGKAAIERAESLLKYYAEDDKKAVGSEKMQPKKVTSFRLSEVAREILRRNARAHGVYQASILELAIRQFDLLQRRKVTRAKREAVLRATEGDPVVG